MAMAPAATSARPAVRIRLVWFTAPDSPAARANGTVRPSDIPMTTSRTDSEAVKCFSTWGDRGISIVSFRTQEAGARPGAIIAPGATSCKTLAPVAATGPVAGCGQPASKAACRYEEPPRGYNA